MQNQYIITILLIIIAFKIEEIMIELFNEIANNWKLEAKSENSDRYFFQTPELEDIISGKKCYVIGRKGTGKTAISEKILNISKHNYFSEKLSFKNFPFEELYKHQDCNFRFPNQYITIWKYIIYSKICQLMTKNKNIDSNISSKLLELFPSDPLKRLDREIMKLTNVEFNAKVSYQGFGIGGGFKKNINHNNSAWIDKVEILEDVIAEYIDNSVYFICFDELDEDYQNMIDISYYNQYIQLLTGLFKAVQNIKNMFKSNRYNIYPVIFLRNDIYEIIRDPDKAKWDDYKIDLEWSLNSIKNLLAFRIERAIDDKAIKYSFDRSWHKLFSNNKIGVGFRDYKKIDIFTYMTRSTHLRPRDYVSYILMCVKNNCKNTLISVDAVKEADKNFSYYLKSELISEIQGILPDIESIFNIISIIRKQTFSFSEFNDIYLHKLKEWNIKDYGVEFVLKLLFFFSVIGNQPRQANRKIFHYTDRGAQFNYKEQIMIHRGLYQALQIF